MRLQHTATLSLCSVRRCYSCLDVLRRHARSDKLRDLNARFRSTRTGRSARCAAQVAPCQSFSTSTVSCASRSSLDIEWNGQKIKSMAASRSPTGQLHLEQLAGGASKQRWASLYNHSTTVLLLSLIMVFYTAPLSRPSAFAGIHAFTLQVSSPSLRCAPFRRHT